jgi:hypothetical protein
MRYGVYSIKPFLILLPVNPEDLLASILNIYLKQSFITKTAFEKSREMPLLFGGAC